MSMLSQHKITVLKAPAPPFEDYGRRLGDSDAKVGRSFGGWPRFSCDFSQHHRPEDTPRPKTCHTCPCLSQIGRALAHRCCDVMKDIGHGKTARSLQIEATHRLADDDSHLEQTQAQRREAGPAKSVEFLTDFGVGCDLRRFSNGVTDLKEQPIGQRSQDEPKTVGLVEMTADSVAFKPTFKLTDVSFTATSTTVGHLVEQPGRKLIEIGDHESGIVPEHGHLRLSNDMARAFPGAGLIHKVDEDAGRLAALFSKLSGRLQGGLDRVKELAIASQSDEVSDLPERIIEVLETAVDGRAGKAGIGTNHHRAVRSMQYFDSRDDAFKPVLCVRGVMNTAGTKNDGDELTGLVIKEQKRVEDVASMVGIEGQLLLLPMAFKGRGVDVDGDLAPVVVERLDPGEKQLPLHRLKVRQRYCILKPAQRRLRGEVSLTGRTVTSCLEQRIFAQVLGVILIGIAKRDLDDPLQDLVITAVDHAALVALIRHQPCDEFAKPEPLFGLAKQHRSTIGGDVLGRKIDVDGKFGVEIEAGFRVTLCHEKRGCWRCGIRELHQQFTRVFRSRKALSGELFRLVLTMTAVGCSLPDLPPVEKPAQCFGMSEESCQRTPNCYDAITNVDYRGWATEKTCVPDHTCRHVATGDAMGSPHEAECPTGSVCLNDRAFSASQPYCFPKAGLVGVVEPNQCGTSRVLSLRATPEGSVRLGTDEFRPTLYVAGFSENGVVLDGLHWEDGGVEPLLEFEIPQEVAEECVDEDLIQENLRLRLSPREEFRGAMELSWNVRCGEEIFTIVEAANHRRPDELRYSEVLTGQTIEPRPVEFWQVPVEARWDESAGRIAVIHVDGEEERDLLEFDAANLVADSLRVTTDLTTEQYLLTWLSDGEDGRDVMTTVVSSADQWATASANTPEVLHAGAATVHAQRMDQDFGVLVTTEAGDEVISFRLYPDGHTRDVESQPFPGFGQPRVYAPVFDDTLILSDEGILAYVCSVDVD